ncbi:MAG TPA: hypothetical protein VGM62_08240 [Chthoniobacterales bacterium]
MPGPLQRFWRRSATASDKSSFIISFFQNPSGLNYTCGNRFEAQNAGFDPGAINPLVIQAMEEVGIDLSQKQTSAVFGVWKSGQIFQSVITVCSEAEAHGCPIFFRSGDTLALAFSRSFATYRQQPREAAGESQNPRQIRVKIEAGCEEVCPEALGVSVQL